MREWTASHHLSTYDCREEQLVSLVFQNPRFADNGDIGSCDTSLTMSAELTRGDLQEPD